METLEKINDKINQAIKAYWSAIEERKTFLNANAKLPDNVFYKNKEGDFYKVTGVSYVTEEDITFKAIWIGLGKELGMSSRYITRYELLENCVESSEEEWNTALKELCEKTKNI